MTDLAKAGCRQACPGRGCHDRVHGQQRWVQQRHGSPRGGGLVSPDETISCYRKRWAIVVNKEAYYQECELVCLNLQGCKALVGSLLLKHAGQKHMPVDAQIERIGIALSRSETGDLVLSDPPQQRNQGRVAQVTVGGRVHDVIGPPNESGGHLVDVRLRAGSMPLQDRLQLPSVQECLLHLLTDGTPHLGGTSRGSHVQQGRRHLRMAVAQLLQSFQVEGLQIGDVHVKAASADLAH